MIVTYRWKTPLSALLVTLLLSACGIGGQDVRDPPADAPPNTPTTPTPPSQPGAPTLVGNTATDGFNWFNYRRAQIGLPVLARNAQLDAAAVGHSNYLRQNNTVSHDQISGKPGFTGVHLDERLAKAGYVLGANNFAYGEVISAANDTSGFYHAEELISAIYHRFVIFQPIYKELGVGTSAGSGNYTYFTADFGATNGQGPGVTQGTVAVYPGVNQTLVPLNFLSDNESPDPVPSQNEVGYPISVHTNFNSTVTVQRFTVRPRGGSDLSVRVLAKASDTNTPQYAAAIVPLTVLRANTVYEVTFEGAVDGVALTRNWTFTTK